MGIKDLFRRGKSCSVVDKEGFLNKVVGNQYLVKEMFVSISKDRTDIKAMMPGMVLSIESKFNDEIRLKKEEVVATLITNKGSLSKDLIKLIKQKRIEAIDVFIEKYSLNWFTVILDNKSFFNLEKITIEEYNIIRKKCKESGSFYLPSFPLH